MSEPRNAALEIEHLSLSFRNGDAYTRVLHDVNLRVRKGRVLGVVGESGSGKTVSSLACMGLLPTERVRIDGGRALYDGDLDLLSNGFERARELRGSTIAMIFQEPMSSLNPSMRCGEQVAEVVRLHRKLSGRKAVSAAVLEHFREVELPEPEAMMMRYPHELSGGQKQRVMIALALAGNPELIIADEPTTALDVTVQKSIIALLRRLQRERGLSMLFISHDLELVAKLADDVAVMWQGRVVEQGAASAVITQPQHAYTRGLLACRPPTTGERIVLPTVQDALESRNPEQHTFRSAPPNEVILKASDLRKSFVTRRNILGKPTAFFEAVRGVSFELFRGETLGIVGESGCGKSTLSRMLTGLIAPDSGCIAWELEQQPTPAVQLVFQDPYSALNPRMTAADCLAEALLVSKQAKSASSARQGALQLMEEVGLPAGFADRYPKAFSGGQRQRLVVARALCANPKVLLLDESVAALDISVQAQVLNLLNRLKEERDLTYIFISHDLNVVRFMSDRILVMYRGRIEEIGSAEAIMNTPKQRYTQQLVSAAQYVE